MRGPLSYFIADQLGTTTGVIDGATGAIARQSYWPCGATRSTTGALGTDKQYTGQQAEAGDAALGLYNYNARFYSTTLGRFASADPIAVDGLNRYSYVMNNPARYTDPSGRCIFKLPCEPKDQLAFIQCAFQCTDDTFGPMAREVVSSFDFWGKVISSYNASSFPALFITDIIVTIANFATPSTFWAISETGFKFLAGATGATPGFFALSLYDFAFGTHLMRRMPDNVLEGASPWWDRISAYLYQAAITDTQKAWVDGASYQLAHLTYEHARLVQAAGDDPNLLDKRSPWQRNVALHNQPGLDVDLADAESEPDISCLSDPACLQRYSTRVIQLPNEPQYQSLPELLGGFP